MAPAANYSSGPLRGRLEELTRLDSHEAVSDALYERARAVFDEDALVDLTLLVVMINAWNRINVAARTVGGSYKPAAH